MTPEEKKQAAKVITDLIELTSPQQVQETILDNLNLLQNLVEFLDPQ